jgi:hypothetical protein
MTNYIILVLCLLIMLAYLFDITSRYSKIPGVILLIGLGIIIGTYLCCQIIFLYNVWILYKA